MEIDKKTIKEIIEDSMDLKGISIDRLAEITDIPERFIRAIMDENIPILPSSPYVRGYLIKIAETLNLNGNDLWQIYRKNLAIKISGEKDKLPNNRFETKNFKKKNVIFIALAVIFIIYLISMFDKFMGVPFIDIGSPVADNMVVEESLINLSGRVNPQDKLMINNEEILSDKNGYFEKQFLLELGVNSIEFKAKRLLGKEVIIIRKVIYQQKITND